MAGTRLSSPGELNAAVQRASAILGSDPAAAQREAEAILAITPNDPRGLLILGSARRRRGDATGALAILERLARAFPNAAHTQYELGAALAAVGRAPAAVSTLRRAVSLKGDLAEAWRALGDLLFAQGDTAGADAAFAAHHRATIREPALAEAADAYFAGRLPEAERRLRDHLTLQPNDAPALRLMAEVFSKLERHRDAETLLEHALRIDPDHQGARFTYANALYRQQKAAQALPHVEWLLARDPREPAYRNLLAVCLVLLGDFGRAIETYENLLADFPRQPTIWLNHGHALRAVGRRAEALNAYRRAIALAPGLGDAYLGLADLKVARLSREDEAAMNRQLHRRDLADGDRLPLHFALGKALEDRRDYAGAFATYAAGAALRRRAVSYDPDANTAQLQRSKALFTPAFFAAREGAGSPAADPIFIVGLPRSGSTLIEQILASHSAVEGTMELPDIGFIAADLERGSSRGYPEGLAELDAAALADLGERYLRGVAVQRRQGRPFFVDKMPHNFQHIGLIRVILPHARIIDARRHPLGACVSAFTQHFAQGQAFSYDLDGLGRYYRDYVDLMAHFDAVLPGRVCRVIYEDLVEDTEAQVRRLLDYCGLPFEDACLHFHETERAVRTLSSEQVRQPIYRDGLERWRGYAPWLGPLEDALGPALENWRGG